MSKAVVQQIRSNYSFYETLLKERKSIFSGVISISKIGNNANILEEITHVKHVTLPNSIILIVNVKANNHNFFQFKLRCKDLSDVPFFRYDSDGETHRNYDEDIPLSQQQVTTPHFHHYNSKGINIAYKTDKLMNESEKKALEDINICIKHFCHEANLRLNEDDFPEIQIAVAPLHFKTTIDDPNSNVQFL